MKILISRKYDYINSQRIAEWIFNFANRISIPNKGNNFHLIASIFFSLNKWNEIE